MYPSHVPTCSLLCEFDYLDNKRDGFPTLRNNPTACDHGFTVLKIDTSANNWFLSGDIIELGDILHNFTTRYDIVIALCFSMGIMPALMFSKQLRIQKLLSFSPVISIFEDDIPDRRFKSFRKNITHPEYRNLWKNGSIKINGSLCFDSIEHPFDRMQARLIHDHYPNLKSVAMPFGRHPCFQIIKEIAGFNSIQDLIFNDQYDPCHLRKLHKQNRKTSDIYLKGMQSKDKQC